MKNQESSTNTGHYPMDNLTYDLITILHEKSKALEAFDKYFNDARGNERVKNLLERMRNQDRDFVEELQQCLALMLGEARPTTGEAANKGASMQQGKQTRAKGRAASTDR